MDSSASTLNRDQWFAALQRIADALGSGPEVRLCFIVSKLIRCEPRDLSDIRFLISRYQPDLADIRLLISTLSPRNREQASENLIYLTIAEP